MKRRPHLIPALIVVIMLIVAIAPLAYVYYQLLRWVVCGVAVFIAVLAYRWKRIWAICLFGLVAILFNPLAPIYLTKQIWQPIDLACAVLFITSIFVLREPKRSG
jgi:FtsH-binding integral membrane protein